MDKSYRIIISIIRGTNAGRALTMMANGITVSAEDYDGAMALVEKYLDAAACILCSADKGIVFGTISILNLKDAKVEHSEVLVGTGQVLRSTSGGVGKLAPGEAARFAS